MRRKPTLPRRFAILGAVLFLIAASGLTYFDYRLAVERMADVQHSASMVAARTLWTQLQNYALPLFGISERGPPVRGIQALIIEEIDQQTRETLLNTDIDKIKIYDAHGRVLYSTDHAQIGDDDSKNPRFQASIAGEESSYREELGSIVTIHGPQRNVVMQATYVPIFSPLDNIAPIGVFEIFTDFSRLEKAAQVRAWVRVSVVALGLAILYGLLVLIVTLNDRALRKAEEERGNAIAEVVKVRAEDASKSAFLAHMSHELRTPLNAIIGFSEFIEKAESLHLSQDKIIEYAGDIRMSAAHLLRIINDLLDLTRLDLGRIRPEVDAVKLTDVVREAMSMVSTQAAQGNVTLASRLPEEPVVVQTDRQRVKQILVNLLSNAVKFTPELGSVTAILSVHPADNLVLLRVVDTGIGRSGDETSDRLNILKYGDAMIARKLAGGGLGLPLCQRYARLLGGDLRIESELGRGTTVTLEIPLRPRAIEPSADDKQASPGESAAA